MAEIRRDAAGKCDVYAAGRPIIDHDGVTVPVGPRDTAGSPCIRCHRLISDHGSAPLYQVPGLCDGYVTEDNDDDDNGVFGSGGVFGAGGIFGDDEDDAPTIHVRQHTYHDNTIITQNVRAGRRIVIATGNLDLTITDED